MLALVGDLRDGVGGRRVPVSEAGALEQSRVGIEFLGGQGPVEVRGNREVILEQTVVGGHRDLGADVVHHLLLQIEGQFAEGVEEDIHFASQFAHLGIGAPQVADVHDGEAGTRIGDDVAEIGPRSGERGITFQGVKEGTRVLVALDGEDAEASVRQFGEPFGPRAAVLVQGRRHRNALAPRHKGQVAQGRIAEVVRPIDAAGVETAAGANEQLQPRGQRAEQSAEGWLMAVVVV